LWKVSKSLFNFENLEIISETFFCCFTLSDDCWSFHLFQSWNNHNFVKSKIHKGFSGIRNFSHQKSATFYVDFFKVEILT